jgi:hypothetical protein
MRYRLSDVVSFYYDVAIREIGSLRRHRVTLVLLHQYADHSKGGCLPGEEVIAAFVAWRGNSYKLPLSSTHLILLDYLAKHRGVAQNASQIADGLNSELFYVHHAWNAPGRRVKRARSSRTAVKKQVSRIRVVMNRVFRESHLPLHAETIIQYHSIPRYEHSRDTLSTNGQRDIRTLEQS